MSYSQQGRIEKIENIVGVKKLMADRVHIIHLEEDDSEADGINRYAKTHPKIYADIERNKDAKLGCCLFIRSMPCAWDKKPWSNAGNREKAFFDYFNDRDKIRAKIDAGVMLTRDEAAMAAIMRKAGHLESVGVAA